MLNLHLYWSLPSLLQQLLYLEQSGTYIIYINDTKKYVDTFPSYPGYLKCILGRSPICLSTYCTVEHLYTVHCTVHQIN